MALDFSVLPARYREAAERRFSESPSGITQDWLNALATKPNAIIEAFVFHEKGSASEGQVWCSAAVKARFKN